jgi:hypothetical protein
MKLRKVEVFRSEGWEEVRLSEIKKGEKFRMFEPDDGEAVENNNGSTEFVACSEPFLSDLGPDGSTVWTIESDDDKKA